MKTMKCFAMAAIMMVAGAVTVNAQERVVTLGQLKDAQNNRNTTVNNSNNTVVNNNNYYSSSSSAESFSSVYLQYNISSMRSHSEYSGHKYNDSEGFSAITLGWNTSLALFGDLPLYLQPGLALTYGWHTEKDDEHGSGGYDYDYDDDEHEGGDRPERPTRADERPDRPSNGSGGDKGSSSDPKTTMLSVKIPVNLMYSIKFGDSSVSLDPYVGIYGRCFVFAQTKVGGETYSMFSKDDVGEDMLWNRFQIGAQAGVNLRFNKFYVGAEYAMDATEVWKHEKNTQKINALSINLGFCF